MDKIIAICGTIMFLGILTCAFLDGAHHRTVLHACQIAAIEARYPSADAALICNLK
jgi:hypothetical protein